VLIKIIVLSMILERIWEHLQLLLDDPLSKRMKVIGSALLAMLAAFTLQLDLLHALEIFPTISVPGFLLTGVVLGLGSNVLHDVIDLVNGISTKQRG